MLTVKEEKNKDERIRPDGGGGFQASVLSMIRENLHYNLGTLLLGLLVMLFNCPILTALSLSDIKHRMDQVMVSSTAISIDGPTSVFIAEKISSYQTQMTSAANELLSGRGGLMSVIVPVAAILCARAMFIYLMQRSTADFYFSEPLSRTRRFCANYISGVIIMLLCMAFGFLGSLIVSICFGVTGLLIPEALMTQLGFLLIFLIFYSTFIIAMLLTGKPFAAVAAAIVINGIGMALYAIFMVYLNLFETFAYESQAPFEKLWYLCPLYYMVDFLNEAGSRAGVLEAGSLRLMGIMALISVFLIAAAALLHRIRPAESCGRTLSFKATSRPLRILLAVIGGLLISFLGFTEAGILWIFFFAVLGTIIVHAICEISFNMDIRRLFDHKIEKLICIAAGLVFICIFIFDPFGYDSYVPKAEDVESVAFSYSGDFEARYAIPDSEYDLRVMKEDPDMIYTGEYYDGKPELMDRMAITEEPYVSSVLDLMREGARRASGINDMGSDSYDSPDNEEDHEIFYVNAVYRLKNGRLKYRNYHISSEELSEHMPNIFPSMEYKTAMYPILELSEDELLPGLFGIEYKDREAGEELQRRGKLSGKILALEGRSNIDWKEFGNVYDINEDASFEKELLAALKKDLEEMQYEDYHEWLYSVDEVYEDDGTKGYFSDSKYYKGEQEAGVYLNCDLLHFVPASSVELSELRGLMTETDIYGGYREYYEYEDIYPIFESFTHVRELLSEHGLLSED